MATDFFLTAPQSAVESMDSLSRDWCNSTIQVYHPSLQDEEFPFPKMEKPTSMDVPPWKGKDVKSWLWLQQAMHPEINYSSCLRKKWCTLKLTPFSKTAIKKWFKKMKQKRKEDDRLQRAELHAAISMAGLAAALAAVAAENSKKNQSNNSSSNNNNSNKECVVASATAMVAAQCAKVAEAMGAPREQLSTVMGSAMSSASATEILTLTAAAATSLRGAATLKARPGRRDRFSGRMPVMSMDDNMKIDFDFDKFLSMLAKGADLTIEKPDGKSVYRSVSIILNQEAKVFLKIRKINMLTAFARTKECLVLNLHAELYEDSYNDEGTSYYVVLTTNQGIFRLDMEDDYDRCRMWTQTINHMLMFSMTYSGYEVQYYRK